MVFNLVKSQLNIKISSTIQVRNQMQPTPIRPLFSSLTFPRKYKLLIVSSERVYRNSGLQLRIVFLILVYDTNQGFHRLGCLALD